MRRTTILLWGWISVFSSVLSAQSSHFGTFREHFPVNGEGSYKTEFADFNGDGFKDYITVGRPSTPTIYFGDGLGFYTESSLTQPFAQDYYQEVAVLDVEVDGDMDVMFQRTNAFHPELFTNNGSGQFTLVSNVFPPLGPLTHSWHIEVADYDGDGDPDIFLPVQSSNGILFQNQGNLTFADATLQLAGFSTRNFDARFVDLDGINGPDLVRHCFTNQVEILVNLNNGSGFPNVTSVAPTWTPFTSKMKIGDLNADGAQDILILEQTATQPIAVFTNNGSGSFTGPTNIGPSWQVLDFEVGEMNGDNALDFFFLGFNNRLEYWQNNGSGGLSQTTAPGLDSLILAHNIFTEDVDQDGDQDIVQANEGGPDQLLLNNGSASFTHATGGQLPYGYDGYYSASAGDVDGDGDLDIVVGLSGFLPSPYVWINDNTGRFVDETATRFAATPGVASRNDVNLLDLDGDQDPDLLSFNSSAPAAVYINNNGVFSDQTSTWLPGFTTTNIVHVDIGDINNDGRPDAVIGDGFTSATVTVLQNSGTQLVPCTTCVNITGSQSVAELALADINQDNNLDLIVAVYPFPSGTIRVYLGDGQGGFNEVSGAFPITFQDFVRAIIAHDMNGDGFKDLILAGNPTAAAPIHGGSVWINNGSSVFSDQTSTYWPTFTGSFGDFLVEDLELGDFNGDGREDLLVGQRQATNGSANLLFVADAQGRFTTSGEVWDGKVQSDTWNLLVADFDSDQDLDAVAVNGDQPSRLYFGLRRQASFLGHPAAGSEAKLRFHNEPNTPAALFIAFIPPVPAFVPIAPWGTWMLGGGGILLVNLALSPNGDLTVPFTMPALPGATLFWQTIFIEPSVLDLRFSNLEATFLR